ncbi:MAG: DUF2207 domain-containing protein, partial [Peptostreptococcaceae bacterium]|nr:DUF2207 domain-containing protein [Peptostreptococcaceae bacterium]
MSRCSFRSIKWILPLIVFAIFLVPMQSHGAEAFEIRDYDVNVSVGEDNSYEVKETIKVEFSEPRHGIYRTIPTSYDGRQAKISNIEVPGREIKTSRSSGNLVIQIGSADEYVSGFQTYVIAYRFALPIDRYEDYDEFYFNLIGNEWPVSIDRVSFSVDMPKPFDSDNVSVYSGAYGSESSDGVDFNVGAAGVNGKTLKMLLPGESVTMRIELEEGYFKESFLSRLTNLFFEYAYILLGGLLLLLGFFTWKKYGQDEQMFVAPEFYPPENMTPAEVGYIIDSTMDNKDVTALLIYWASKGYMAIEEIDKKNVRFHKLKEADDSFKSFEKIMFASLFDEHGVDGKVETEDLKYQFANTISAVKSEISDSLGRYAEKPLYTKKSKNLGMMFKALALLPLYLMAMKYLNSVFGAGPRILLTALIPTLAIYIPIALFIEGFKRRYVISKGSMVLRVMLFVVIFVFGAIIGFLLYLVVKTYGVNATMIPFILAAASTVGIYALGAIMKQKTEYGKRVMEKILGLKQFIETAEKPKLEMLFDENPSYFYDVLSYAVV